MPLIGNRRRHFKTLKQIANRTRIETVRALNARTSASLYCLPADLICHICGFLPHAETFCLMISCAHFWHSRTEIPAFKRVQQLLDATANNHWRLIEIKFHILRLMEFDKICGKGTKQFCCWACMRTHRISRFNVQVKEPVNLKFSIEEQRFNSSAAVTRSCIYRGRKIWAGLCYEMTWAELRILVLGLKNCGGKAPPTAIIRAGGFFSEHVEYVLDTNHLSSRFCLGRMSDLGLSGFDQLCRMACIPICPHATIDVLANVFLRAMNPGDVWTCQKCRTKYHVTITSYKMIELHISHYVGTLRKHDCQLWMRASYQRVNPEFVEHCRLFADWLKRMYHPITGAVYNGRQFEMFSSPPTWYRILKK